jgi:hypothetical protein
MNLHNVSLTKKNQKVIYFTSKVMAAWLRRIYGIKEYKTSLICIYLNFTSSIAAIYCYTFNTAIPAIKMKEIRTTDCIPISVIRGYGHWWRLHTQAYTTSVWWWPYEPGESRGMGEGFEGSVQPLTVALRLQKHVEHCNRDNRRHSTDQNKYRTRKVPVNK